MMIIVEVEVDGEGGRKGGCKERSGCGRWEEGKGIEVNVYGRG